MIVHYIKIAWRYLLKQRLLTIINILGITVGVTVSLLITMYIKHDLGYDQYHEKASRIYRIGLHGKMGETEFTQTYTTPQLASELINTVPEIETAVRMNDIGTYIKYEDNKGYKVIHEEKRIVSADSSLFDIFTFHTLAGDPRQAIKEPGTIIFFESALGRYFEDVKNYEKIIGTQLQVANDGEYFPITIQAILKDIPEQSHFHFDFIISNENFPFAHYDSWWNNYFRTYFLLREHADAKSVEKKLPEIYRKNMGEDQFDAWLAEGNRWESFVQPLLDIHLESNVTGEWEANGNIQYIWIFTVAALFIIIIACVNYINLSTAKASIRAREIGIKKTIGSRRYQLVLQLLTEALIISFFAVNFALIWTKLSLPIFNRFTGKFLEFGIFYDYRDLLVVLGFILLLGFLSGIYPALYITSYQPVYAIKGKNLGNQKHLYFRNILVIFQFLISIIIITGTFLIDKQMNFLQNKNLGFVKENVIVLQNVWPERPDIKTFKDELNKYEDIKSVSSSFSVPGRGQGNIQFRPEGYEDNILMDIIFADEDFVETIGLKMLIGRYFDIHHSSDSFGIVINKAAMINLGWGNPLGKEIKFGGKSGIPCKVIGVVDDFHYISMHEAIRPFVILPSFNKSAWSDNTISIKFDGNNVPETLKLVEKTWQKFTELPFEYFFLDESYDNLYKNEADTRAIFRTFSIITIFIAVMGLFGLVTYDADQRTKEIGIRKVMGASSSQIIVLLSGHFTKWIFLGFIFAVPLSWWVMDKWLGNFAYKTSISGWIYVITLIIVLAVSWITVSYQSIRAALKNPVEALRYE